MTRKKSLSLIKEQSSVRTKVILSSQSTARTSMSTTRFITSFSSMSLKMRQMKKQKILKAVQSVDSTEYSECLLWISFIQNKKHFAANVKVQIENCNGIREKLAVGSGRMSRKGNAAKATAEDSSQSC